MVDHGNAFNNLPRSFARRRRVQTLSPARDSKPAGTNKNSGASPPRASPTRPALTPKCGAGWRGVGGGGDDGEDEGEGKVVDESAREDKGWVENDKKGEDGGKNDDFERLLVP